MAPSPAVEGSRGPGAPAAAAAVIAAAEAAGAAEEAAAQAAAQLDGRGGTPLRQPCLWQ